MMGMLKAMHNGMDLLAKNQFRNSQQNFCYDTKKF
jgi:hypothetical protein